MTEALIPPWVTPETPERYKLLDDGTSFFQPAFGRGRGQTQIYNDPRWQITRRYKAMRLNERGHLTTALLDARGKGVNIRVCPHRPPRGTFPAVELLTNNQNFNGTTGWVSGNTAYLTVSASDGRLRLTRAGTTSISFRRTSSVNFTNDVPYVARAFVRKGKGPVRCTVGIGSTVAAFDVATSGQQTEQMLMMAAGVAPTGLGTACYFTFSDSSGGGKLVSDFIELTYTSLARCMLADNVSNLLRTATEFDHANWAKTRATVTANTQSAPIDSVVGDTISEDGTAANSHYIAQAFTGSATADEDYCFGVALKASNRTWGCIQILDDVTGDSLQAWFNLSTGAKGTVNSNGTSWDYERSFIEPLGDGWYACYVLARRTTTNSAMTARIVIAEGDNDNNFSGLSQSSLFAWGATVSKSSVPMRLHTTSVAAAVSDTLQSGGELYVKGLPASTQGLLLPDDWVGINGELKRLTQPLDSTAAGLGMLQFRPGLVNPPADNSPVIVHEPFGTFKLMDGVELDEMFGLYTDTELTLTEHYE